MTYALRGSALGFARWYTALAVVATVSVAATAFAAPPAEGSAKSSTVYGKSLQPSGATSAILVPSQAMGLNVDVLDTGRSLAELDVAGLLAEDAMSTDLRPRVAVTRKVPRLTASEGVWRDLGDLGWLWIASVTSPGAYNTRLHFTDMQLPDGGELYVYGPAEAQITDGPFGGVGPFGHGSFWSPLVSGETAVVEYLAPAGPKPTALPFRIDDLMHMYVDVFGESVDGPYDCLEDVKCHWPKWEDLSNAVARILFNDPPGSGAWYLCSGTLLDSQQHDETPYFITANHCIGSDAVAETMILRWKYESTACDSGQAGGGYQESYGGDVLWTDAGVDVTLTIVVGDLKTNTLPYFWSGWTGTTVADDTELTCVSHPAGTYKKISIGTKLGDSGPKHNISWFVGGILGGSSGSGVWREDLGGQLYCGTASTSSVPVDCTNPDGPSQYGRFDLAYPFIAGYLFGGTDDDLENNDSCAAAADLSSGSQYNRIVKRVDEDWYRISVPGCNTIDVTTLFTDANGNIDIELYDGCGGSVVASSASVSNNESLTYFHAGDEAQDYMLRVYLAESTRNKYSIGVTLTDECTPCAASGARSYRVHGPAGRIPLDVGLAGGIDPRIGGVTELEIDVDTVDGFFGDVEVDCDQPWTGSATTEINGNTIVVNFDPALPNASACTVTCDCGAAVCVRSLEGDASRDGQVTTLDAAVVKDFFGAAPDPVTTQYDLDANGIISTNDYSQVKTRFGMSAPDCP